MKLKKKQKKKFAPYIEGDLYMAFELTAFLIWLVLILVVQHVNEGADERRRLRRISRRDSNPESYIVTY